MSTKKKTKSDSKKKKKRCCQIETSCSKSLRHKLRSLEGHQAEIGLVNGRTIIGTIVHVTKGKVKLAIHCKGRLIFVHITICHIDSVKVVKHKHEGSEDKHHKKDCFEKHHKKDCFEKHRKKDCFEKHEQVV